MAFGGRWQNMLDDIGGVGSVGECWWNVFSDTRGFGLSWRVLVECV